MSAVGRRLAITDNNLLVNFVDAGEAGLLVQYCKEPLLISPSVIEPTETPPFDFQPRSEFNIIIYKAQLALRRQQLQQEQQQEVEPLDELLQQRAMHRLAFLKQQGVIWKSVELTEDDARHRYTIQNDPRLKRLKRRQADAECLTVALRRSLILLTDDQPVVDAAGLLGVSTMRTCALLLAMTEEKLLTPERAAYLFNEVMVDQLHFNARRTRAGVRERLVLGGNPLTCQWRPDLST